MSRCFSLTGHLLVAGAALFVGSCRPLGLVGDSCHKGPCASGLTCLDGICADVEPLPTPPGPCQADDDCALDGSADGRVCVEGVCTYDACAFDLQCGVRICENGFCADRELCLNDESCGAGRVCVGNACREACVADEECPSLGAVALAACVEGECVQRCLGDFMCLQGICDANLCRAPDCADDADCEGPGSYFCDAGRCTQFTPCKIEDDCFDPNFLCNAQGRCEERAACTVDAACGAGLCLDRHCRAAVPCGASEGCADDLQECVAGRCVDVSECRSDADCPNAEVCDAARCAAAPSPVDPSILVVRTSHGPCVSGSGGACELVCFEGETVTLPIQGYDVDGVPVAAASTVTGAANAVVSGGRLSLPCPAAVEAAPTVVTVQAGAISVDVALRALSRVGDLVVVVLSASGAPVAGAAVFVDDAPVGATGGDGALSLAPFVGGTIGASADGRGAIVFDARPGSLFVTLPADDRRLQAAGFRARVNGTGDELGDVGVGLALPSTRGALSSSPQSLFGEPFAGSVELPLLGAVPVVVPAAATLDARLLLVGPQEVKAFAFDTATAGPGALLAFEGRFDQQLLFDIALAADPVEVSLDIAALAEGMDARVAGAGLLSAIALVVDGDVADGLEDIDGDGDIAELVPDYGSFPEIEVRPEASPLERVGLRVSAPPGGANARALAVCGVELAHGFLPLGLGVLFGSSEGEQVKVKSAPATMSVAGRACAVHAVFGAGDGRASAAVVTGQAFGSLLDVGTLLAPPEGAFLLEGVPTADRTSVIVPEAVGADALSVTVLDGETSWELVVAARGSIALPSYLVPISLGAAKAYLLRGDVVQALSSPVRSLDDVAAAVASAP